MPVPVFLKAKFFLFVGCTGLHILPLRSLKRISAFLAGLAYGPKQMTLVMSESFLLSAFFLLSTWQ